MSTEELFKTRYKVIANYPGQAFKIGEIITDRFIDFNYCHKYPALFKPLQWWEERDLYRKEVEKEVIALIPYLKANGNLYKGEVYKIKEFTAALFGYMSGVRNAFVSEIPSRYGNTVFQLEYFEPATEQEYNDYLKQSKK